MVCLLYSPVVGRLVALVLCCLFAWGWLLWLVVACFWFGGCFTIVLCGGELGFGDCI